MTDSTSVDISHLLKEIRQLGKFKDAKDYEISYVLPMVNLITECFITNASASLAASLHSQLWKTIKEMVDKVKTNSADDAKFTNLFNAYNLCVSWLVDLCLSVQRYYDVVFTMDAIPIIASQAGLRECPLRPLKYTEQRQFEYYISLRLGDIMRYKNNLPVAETLYKAAARSLPMFGDPWNQLGLLSSIQSKLVDSVYYHARAVHCKHSFASASSNIQSLLTKYLEKTPSTTAPFQERFISLLAKCHFLRRVDPSLAYSVADEITTVVPLISMISVYSNLGCSEDELRARRDLKKVTNRLANNIISRIIRADDPESDDMWILATILRIGRIVPPTEKDAELLLQKLRKWNRVMKDKDYLVMFTAVDDCLPRPLTTASLADAIEKRMEEAPASDDESDLDFLPCTSDEVTSSLTPSVDYSKDVLEMSASSEEEFLE